MGGKCTTSEALRVVVLSHDDAIPGELSSPWPAGALECVRVATGYEAAAELLAAPTGALVVDLRAMPSRHLPLLRLARAEGVRVLALGPAPRGPADDDLGGAERVAREDAPFVLRRTLVAPPAGRAEPSADADERPAAGKYVPDARTPDKDASPAASSEGILTAEELEALLGGGS